MRLCVDMEKRGGDVGPIDLDRTTMTFEPDKLVFKIASSFAILLF